MIHFGVKFWARSSQNKLHRINSVKNLSKFCLHKFSPKKPNLRKTRFKIQV